MASDCPSSPQTRPPLNLFFPIFFLSNSSIFRLPSPLSSLVACTTSPSTHRRLPTSNQSSASVRSPSKTPLPSVVVVAPPQTPFDSLVPLPREPASTVLRQLHSIHDTHPPESNVPASPTSPPSSRNHARTQLKLINTRLSSPIPPPTPPSAV